MSFLGISLPLPILTTTDPNSRAERVHQWRRDWIAQMGIFAVCSRVFTYHLVIDNVVMAFLVLAMAITWIEGGMLPRPGVVLGALVSSLLLPARLTEITAVGIAEQLFWVVALGLLLHARRGRAVSPAAAAHLQHDLELKLGSLH